GSPGAPGAPGRPGGPGGQAPVLPVTGGGVVPTMTGVGSVMVVLGAFAFLLARRRRQES
ncbi:LPXTG cell wall anchor domain-containing protein, partial [Micromonospora sp. M51]|nr:LPXTG cell wall anchor domain-containing protein [Micromonospora sp. M51]